MKVRFQDAKQAYIEIYGNEVYDCAGYSSFDEAFRAAWDSFDFIPGASTIEEFVEGMSSCPELTEN